MSEKVKVTANHFPVKWVSIITLLAVLLAALLGYSWLHRPVPEKPVGTLELLTPDPSASPLPTPEGVLFPDYVFGVAKVGEEVALYTNVSEPPVGRLPQGIYPVTGQLSPIDEYDMGWLQIHYNNNFYWFAINPSVELSLLGDYQPIDGFETPTELPESVEPELPAEGTDELTPSEG